MVSPAPRGGELLLYVGCGKEGKKMEGLRIIREVAAVEGVGSDRNAVVREGQGAGEIGAVIKRVVSDCRYAVVQS